MRMLHELRKAFTMADSRWRSLSPRGSLTLEVGFLSLTKCRALEHIPLEDLGHGPEHRADAVGILRTGEVPIDLLLADEISLGKLIRDEVGVGLEVVVTAKAGEACPKADQLDLLPEEVLLVEEENHGGMGEPLHVAHRAEELQRFLQPIT